MAVLSLVLTLAALVACADDKGEPGAGSAETADEKAASSRLEAVRARGQLVCAAVTDTPGFGSLDEAGNITGFDIDLCRSVAAARPG